MRFGHLRKEVWAPTFTWVGTSLECADKINSYHEDYPKYVTVTDMVLSKGVTDGKIFNGWLLLNHRTIFSDKSFAGRWRNINVSVGSHRPPSFQNIPYLMEELEEHHSVYGVDSLIEWYKDFETIHPFQDGNGRVGGIVVAIYAHGLHPEKGWLAPNQ